MISINPVQLNRVNFKGSTFTTLMSGFAPQKQLGKINFGQKVPQDTFELSNSKNESLTLSGTDFLELIYR